MSTERFPSKVGVKTAGTWSLCGLAVAWFLSAVCTVPLGWATRPLLAALTVVFVLVVAGFALHVQGGGGHGR